MAKIVFPEKCRVHNPFAEHAFIVKTISILISKNNNEYHVSCSFLGGQNIKMKNCIEVIKSIFIDGFSVEFLEGSVVKHFKINQLND